MILTSLHRLRTHVLRSFSAQKSLRELLQSISEKSDHLVVNEVTEDSVKHGDVRLVMYFDEAHGLAGSSSEDDKGTVNSRTRVGGVGNNTGFPTRTGLDALRACIQHLSRFDVFAIFLSTDSSLLTFAPTSKQHASYRGMSESAKLNAPFVELPFDVLLDKRSLAVESKHRLEEVCRSSFYVRFGRPL